jgi:DNA polymerase type B, organellar and viral
MSRPSFIRGLPPMKKKRSFLIGAIDTETTDLYDARVVLTQVDHETWDKPRLLTDARSLIDVLLSLDEELLAKSIWFSHNAEFDWRLILPEMKRASLASGGELQLELRERSAGKFYEMRVISSTRKTKSGRPCLITRARDSMALYPRSLADLTEGFAPRHVKQDIGLGRGVKFNPASPEHREYAANDVIGLRVAMAGFDDEVYKHFSVHIGPTTSSTAYKAWLRTISPDVAIGRQTPVAEATFRAGYYGGLVGNASGFDEEKGVAVEYPRVDSADINSSYPASMRLGVPAGRAIATYKYHPDAPGFYHCNAIVPMDAILPIVPFRHGKSLAWGRGGPFPTVLTQIEIDYNRELGVEIEVIKGFYFPDGLFFPFNSFVDKCENLRRQYKGTPTEACVKLMQNSLYGRYGMRTEGREIEVHFNGQPDHMESVFDPDTNETIPDVYYTNVERDTEYMQPHWSAWITANSRIMIDRICGAVGREFVLYRDTDSIHVFGQLATERLQAYVGPEYGKLKMEPPKFNVRYHAPKWYTYIDEKGNSRAIAKGIPRKMIDLPDEFDPNFSRLCAERENLIARLHAGKIEPFDYKSVTSLQTWFRTGKLFIERTRSPTNRENVYGNEVENNQWRPRTITAEMLSA